MALQNAPSSEVLVSSGISQGAEERDLLFPIILEVFTVQGERPPRRSLLAQLPLVLINSHGQGTWKSEIGEGIGNRSHAL